MMRLYMQLILTFISLSSQQIWAAREQDVIQPLVHLSLQEKDKNGISTYFYSTLLFPISSCDEIGPRDLVSLHHHKQLPFL